MFCDKGVVLYLKLDHVVMVYGCPSYSTI